MTSDYKENYKRLINKNANKYPNGNDADLVRFQDSYLLTTSATGIGPYPISSTTPNPTDVLAFDGTQYVPSGISVSSEPVGSGIVGPSLSTVNAISRYSNALGSELSNSLVLVDNNGNITIPSGKIIGGIISSSTGILLTTSDYLTIVTSSLSIVFLPLSPSDWEEHIVKVGTGASPLVIDANGSTIDGDVQKIINVDYGSITVVYNTSEWSII